MVPQEKKLLDLLSNNDVTFFIPPYQRNYEWTDDQCSVFLDDLLKTYKMNMNGVASEHFFGSITYFQTEGVFGQPSKLVLIDGQQRITTTMLFLVALRDILGNEDIGNFIDSKYLKNNNMTGESEFKIKLKQVETDWESYKTIILGRELTDNDRQTAVYRNYAYFKNKLKGFLENGYDLGSFVEKGLNKFSVITIELQPDKNIWENPQEIFESMNSLGKPLSLADLVRNYLLLGLDANTQTYLYNKYWLHIEKTLPGKVSNFIRDYMQAHEHKSFYIASDAHHKALYGIFKNIFSETKSEDLLKDLSRNATIYAYCIGNISTGNTIIDGYLADLNRIGATTAYSFLMVLLRVWKQSDLSDTDVISILEAFRIYCLRRRVLALTNGENKAFPLFSNWIDTLMPVKDKKQKMFELLARQESYLRLPNDIELSRHLETMNFGNFAYSKFFLALVEERLTKSRPDLTDKNLQLEHIMPQTLNDDWKKALGSEWESIHQELVGTIGNLTLIRHNQSLGNKKFSEKKQIYENNAGLQIARTEITNHDEWNADAIRSRTQWIINYLLTYVLPIPNEMRKVNNYNVKDTRGLSFQNLQLIGLEIEFTEDPSYKAKVVADKEVEFEGKRWRLSPLTREIQIRRGKVSKSGSYQGAQYWSYEGMRLVDFIGG